MHVRAVALLVLAGMTLSAAGAIACGPAAPENLVAPASLNETLRAAFLRAHPSVRSEDVAGPLPGHTYYGSFGDFHAVAIFEVKGHPAYPATFWRNAGHGWRFSHDTHGGIRNTDISPVLMELWGFRQWRHSPFYVPPVRRTA